MITVKKSITQVLVSVFAAAVMVITSTASVFADNVYTSESGNQWETPASKNGCVHTVSEDGELTSTRTKFRNLGSGKYYEAVNGTWTALEDQETSIPVAESEWLAENQTIATGKAQAKFDFKFDGGAGQRIMFRWRGYNSNLGVRFQKSGAQRIKLNGVPDQNIQVALNDNVWYTAIIVLDLATAEQTVTIKNGSETIAEGVLPLRDGETAPTEKAVTGLCFKSPADLDYTNRVNADVTEVDYPASVWHIRNVSYDAYTETNYALENVYKSTDGMVTNKSGEGFALQGLALTRFTNFAVPANTSLITASYDANKRMVDAEVTNLSQVGTTPVPVGVEGATVKSFILDMDTAKPFVNVYDHATVPTTTVRSADYNDNGFTLAQVNSASNTTTHARYHENPDAVDSSITVDNGALKFERSQIKGSSNTEVLTWGLDETTQTEKVIAVESRSENNRYMVKLDKTATAVNGSFRFKFAGVDHPKGDQQIEVTLGSPQYFIRIQRKADGTSNIYHYFSSQSLGTMKANEWYTLDFSYDGSTITYTVTGDLGTKTSASGTFNKNSGYTVTSFSDVRIGSDRDRDLAFPKSELETPTTGWKTRTSVWWIDDVVVKY